MGTLRFTVIKANLLRNTEIFGKMDPFIEIQHGHKKIRTATIQEGGEKPEWNQTLNLMLTTLKDDQEIKVTCFDEDVIVNDVVGSGTFKLSQFYPCLTPTN